MNVRLLTDREIEQQRVANDIAILGRDSYLPPIIVRRSKWIDFTFTRSFELQEFIKRLTKRWAKGIHRA